jgi:hypothetical protein
MENGIIPCLQEVRKKIDQVIFKQFQNDRVYKQNESNPKYEIKNRIVWHTFVSNVLMKVILWLMKSKH